MRGARRAFVLAYADRFAAMAVNLLTLAITARLLTPQEIGIAVIGLATFGLIDAVRDFGTGAYLVQTEELTVESCRTVFTVTALATACLAAVLWLLSEPIEALYGAAGLSDFLRIGCVSMLFSPFAAPLFARMRRELDFGALLGISVTTSVGSSLLTIALASVGASHTSFAWAGLFSAVVSLALALHRLPSFSIYRPSLAAWRAVVAYGAFDSLRNLLYTLLDTMLFLAFGRLLGPEGVGIYHRASTLSRLPERVVLAGLGPVLLPLFSRRSRDGHDLAESYLSGVAFVTSLLWPSLLVLVILAHPLVLILLGRQWHDAIPLVQIMAAAYLMWFPMNLTNPILIAAGGIRDTFALALKIVPLSIGLQVLAARSGLYAAALSMFVTVPLFVTLSVVAVRRRVPFALSSLAQAMKKSAIVAAITGLGPLSVVAAAGTFEIVSLPLTAFAVLLGAGCWLAALQITGHPMLAELVRLAAATREALPTAARQAAGTDP